MQGPVGQIHTLRVRYADSVNQQQVPSFDTDTVAGDEALSPFKIATAYSGSTTTGKADTTASKEGTGGQQLSIQILKQPVEAKTRKLQARWTFEAAQDAQSMHGIDVEAEVMVYSAQEITAEIDPRDSWNHMFLVHRRNF